MAQLGSIRQMSGQVSHGSAGEYQADEHAGLLVQFDKLIGIIFFVQLLWWDFTHAVLLSGTSHVA